MNLHYFYIIYVKNVFVPSIELCENSTILYQLNLVEQLNLIKNYFRHLKYQEILLHITLLKLPTSRMGRSKWHVNLFNCRLYLRRIKVNPTGINNSCKKENIKICIYQIPLGKKKNKIWQSLYFECFPSV